MILTRWILLGLILLIGGITFAEVPNQIREPGIFILFFPQNSNVFIPHADYENYPQTVPDIPLRRSAEYEIKLCKKKQLQTCAVPSSVFRCTGFLAGDSHSLWTAGHCLLHLKKGETPDLVVMNRKYGIVFDFRQHQKLTFNTSFSKDRLETDFVQISLPCNLEEAPFYFFDRRIGAGEPIRIYDYSIQNLILAQLFSKTIFNLDDLEVKRFGLDIFRQEKFIQLPMKHLVFRTEEPIQLQPGMSGGPILDLNSSVVGILTHKVNELAMGVRSDTISQFSNFIENKKLPSCPSN